MRRLTPLLALPSIALGLAACGQNTIIQSKAQQQVSDFIYSHTHFRPSSVSCPSGVAAKSGNTYDCHFKGPDGSYTAHVQILSVHGQRVENYITARKTG